MCNILDEANQSVKILRAAYSTYLLGTFFIGHLDHMLRARPLRKRLRPQKRKKKHDFQSIVTWRFRIYANSN